MARPRRASRLVSFLCSLALLSASLILAPAAARPASPGCPHASQNGLWSSIPAPVFPAGPPRITTHAFGAHPADHAIYVTNGIAIMGSRDFCSFTEVYRLPDAAGSAEPYSASSAEIVTLEATAQLGFVYAGIQTHDEGRRVHVIRSRDAFGGLWERASGGALEAVSGRLRALASAPSNPEVAYALVDPLSERTPLELPAAETQVLFRTANAGGTWEARSVLARRPSTLPEGLTLPPFIVDDEVNGLEVSPGADGDVWLFGAAGLFQSTDGGSTLAPRLAVPIGVVDAALIPGAGARVRAYELLGSGRMYLSDGGAGFSPGRGPAGIAQSAGSSPGFVSHVVSTNAGVFFSPSGAPGFVDVSPPDRRTILDVAAAPYGVMPNSGMIVGRTDTSIEIVLLIHTQLEEDLPALPPVPLDDSMAETFDDGDIIPDGERIVLDPGEARRIKYRLELPPAPTPLDVYFLIDVSGSMGNAIRGVQVAMNAIIRRLHQRGIDVHFGVGEYRSYTDKPAYKQLRDIGPVNSSLRYALQNLYASGGGEETQLAALYQSVTGYGQDEEYISTDRRSPGERHAYIDPGQNFNFRPTALRVAIHVSDEVFSTGGPHPSYDEVGEVLRAKQVRQVGIAITPEDQQAVNGHPRTGLEKVAYASDAVAPNPVDCDGDGSMDVEAGGPLVCEMHRSEADQAVRMGGVVVELLDAIQDIRDVRIDATRPVVADEAKPSPVVEQVTPALMPDVDLKGENLIQFDVLYRCPEVEKTRRFPVELRAQASSRGLADAVTTVVCRVAEPEEAPAPAARIPVVPVVPPPVRPPEVAPNPNPRPQPNPNPQSAPQTQAGLATQEQEQPQLAFVVQDAAPQAEGAASKAGDEYRMSNYYSRRRPSNAPHPAFVFGAAAMSLTFAFAALARRQARTQYARAVSRPYQ